MFPSINWKLFWILFIASIFGVIAIIPYTLTLQAESSQAESIKDLPMPLYLLLGIQIFENAILFAVLIIVGLYLARKVGLGSPILESWLEGKEVKPYLKLILGISIISGLVVGVVIIGIDLFFIISTSPNALDSTITPPIWQGFLASFYGGINEEIAMRLFLMTFFVWIFSKIKKTEDGKPTNFGIWLAIVITAFLFGIGHLPFTSTLTEITPFIVIRAIILNGIAGLLFGWLYWKKGLESAMISHFSADVVLHAIFPLFI